MTSSKWLALSIAVGWFGVGSAVEAVFPIGRAVRMAVAGLAAVLLMAGLASAHDCPCPPGCVPTGSPTPAPSVVPTPKPTATTLAKCPSDAQMLDGTLTGGWGMLRVPIGAGVVKRFCARLLPPKIGAGVVPTAVVFQWYGHPDQDCARYTMEVQQLSGARLNLRSRVPTGESNGALRFTKRIGQVNDPARVAQGDYLITVVGHAAVCTNTDVTWGWQP